MKYYIILIRTKDLERLLSILEGSKDIKILRVERNLYESRLAICTIDRLEIKNLLIHNIDILKMTETDNPMIIPHRINRVFEFPQSGRINDLIRILIVIILIMIIIQMSISFLRGI